MFQFPARNSGCSDSASTATVKPPFLNVSIPRSEFWLFGHTAIYAIGCINGRFNSPLGILVVRTFQIWISWGLRGSFQFPARNSGCSDSMIVCYITRCSQVSIPRSEFWLFGPLPSKSRCYRAPGFQFPARNSGCSDLVHFVSVGPIFGLFQFPARNSGCSDVRFIASEGVRGCPFQFPARNSGCSDFVMLPGLRA